jgi:signal transduction histidine kinase
MLKGLKEYLDVLFSLRDPIIYSVFFILFFLAIVFIFFKYILYPIQKRHIQEKKEFELKNARLMALFAELDPAPVIRIDNEGKIIHCNNAAMELNYNKPITGLNAAEFFPQLNENPSNLIKENKSFRFFYQNTDRYYEVWFKGISNLGIAQLYFNDLTERNLFEKELVDSKTKLQEFSKHLQDKLEEERQRIARELHDSVGQNLLFIKLIMQNITSEINSENSEKINSALEKSIIELKRILFDLKPRILEEAGLIAAVSTLCKNISEESGISGDVDFVGQEERLDGKIETCIYRVVQEAVSNVVKHSGASNFNILLINSDSTFRVMISDDGTGFQNHKVDSNSHFGLMNMRERVESFRGSFKIESEKNNGTLVVVEIPKNL